MLPRDPLSIAQAKTALRQSAQKTRDTFFAQNKDDHTKASQKIVHQLQAIVEKIVVEKTIMERKPTSEPASKPTSKLTKIIMAYMPMRSEIQLSPWIEFLHNEDAYTLVLPTLSHNDDGVLEKNIIPRASNKSVSLQDQLVPGPYGTTQLSPTHKVIARHDIDLILVPGLLFTPSGYRLGYGGGFYDRFLAGLSSTSEPMSTSTSPPMSAHRTHVIGAFFDAQKRETLPHTENDIPLPCIVTETGVFHTT